MTGVDAAGTVLVVEDDVVSRMVLCRMLHQMGHEPVAADSVRSALEAATSADFGLVISDYLLPDGTGLELLEQLSATGRDRAPFILVTGLGSTEVEAEGWRHRVDAYLTKPVHSRELRACVGQVYSATAEEG